MNCSEFLFLCWILPYLFHTGFCSQISRCLTDISTWSVILIFARVLKAHFHVHFSEGVCAAILNHLLPLSCSIGCLWGLLIVEAAWQKFAVKRDSIENWPSPLPPWLHQRNKIKAKLWESPYFKVFYVEMVCLLLFHLGEIFQLPRVSLYELFLWWVADIWHLLLVGRHWANSSGKLYLSSLSDSWTHIA